MSNPYQVGDQVAYLTLDEKGLRADKAVVRDVNGMDISISPVDDRAAHAKTTITVNDNGVAPEIEPLTPELAHDMGSKDYAVYPFGQRPDKTEREQLERLIDKDIRNDIGRDFGHGY